MLLLRALERQLRRRGASLTLSEPFKEILIWLAWAQLSTFIHVYLHILSCCHAFWARCAGGTRAQTPDWSVESALSYMAGHDISTQHDATERSGGDA
jgi:hypothetical protein